MPTTRLSSFTPAPEALDQLQVTIEALTALLEHTDELPETAMATATEARIQLLDVAHAYT